MCSHRQNDRSFDSCNDFFLDVVKAYVCSAAMSILHMGSVDESPTSVIPPDAGSLNKEQQKKLLDKICAEVADKYVSFQFIKTGNCSTHSDTILTSQPF